MKIGLFNEYRFGVIRDERVVDVTDIVGEPIVAERPAERMLLFIERFGKFKGAMEAAIEPSYPLQEVRLRAPIPRPGKILMGIGNYHENVSTPARPLGMFLKPPSAILDPGGTVLLPPDDAEIFHHEAELAVVIGKTARNVAAGHALDFVFGYSCLLDVSLRSQTAGVGIVGKGFDTFAPLGPWITTADEIPNPQHLHVNSWENDQPRQDYNTDDMEHSVAELIAWASSKLTLEPGDIIGCGTNHQGIGPMQDGETCSMAIEKIGRLTVKVRDPLGRRWPFQIDAGIGKYVRDWKLTGTPGSLERVFMPQIK